MKLIFSVIKTSNSVGKMLYKQKSHSREGQWEHHFRQSNTYELYYHNLHDAAFLTGLNCSPQG